MSPIKANPDFASKQKAFSLIELVCVIVIVSILMALGSQWLSAAREKAKQVQCMANLKAIHSGFMAMCGDRNGFFYTRDEIGNSSYRTVDDPLGLPTIFRVNGYLNNDKVWLSPGGRPELAQYGNNYAWSRSTDITTKQLALIENIESTAIVWNNHTMTLPSVPNVKEPSSQGGPRTAPVQYRYWSWQLKDKSKRWIGGKIHFLWLDGHVTCQ